MSVNLMEGRIDGDENNSENNKKENKIDLTLEKPKQKGVKVSVPNKETINGKVGEQGKVKEIKVKTDKEGIPKVPNDLSGNVSENEEAGVSKLVVGIIMLLVVGTGVLLYMLNSESQFLKGSVNELPTTDSTQIVDDILAEDFNNEASSNESPTEVDTETSSDQMAQNNMEDSSEEEVDNVSNANEESLAVNDSDNLDSQTNGEETPQVESEEDMQADMSNSEELPEVDNSSSEPDIISSYELESSAETTDNLINQNNTNTDNDFSPNTEQSDGTVAEEVMESDEIQGDTGPGLWISAIVATLLSFAYARKNKLSKNY